MTLFGDPPAQGAAAGRPRLVALLGAREQVRPVLKLRAPALGRQSHPAALRARPSQIAPAPMAKVVPLRHPVVVPFRPVGGKDRPRTGRPATERPRQR